MKTWATRFITISLFCVFAWNQWKNLFYFSYEFHRNISIHFIYIQLTSIVNFFLHCVLSWIILCCVLFINLWLCMKFKLENEVNIEIEWIKQTNKWHWFFGFWTNPSKYIYFRCKSAVFQSFLENFINSWAELFNRTKTAIICVTWFNYIFPCNCSSNMKYVMTMQSMPNSKKRNDVIYTNVCIATVELYLWLDTLFSIIRSSMIFIVGMYSGLKSLSLEIKSDSKYHSLFEKKSHACVDSSSATSFQPFLITNFTESFSYSGNSPYIWLLPAFTQYSFFIIIILFEVHMQFSQRNDIITWDTFFCLQCRCEHNGNRKKMKQKEYLQIVVTVYILL